MSNVSDLGIDQSKMVLRIIINQLGHEHDIKDLFNHPEVQRLLPQIERFFSVIEGSTLELDIPKEHEESVRQSLNTYHGKLISNFIAKTLMEAKGIFKKPSSS